MKIICCISLDTKGDRSGFRGIRTTIYCSRSGYVSFDTNGDRSGYRGKKYCITGNW